MWKKMLLVTVVALELTAFAAPAMAVADTDVAMVRAIVEPSIVYLDVTYEAKVWDEFYGQYIREAPFKVSYSCTGFVVNPNGFLVTAGHCVDVDADVRNAILDAAAAWAFDKDYYEFDEGETAADVNRWAHEDFKVEDADGTRGTADVDVTAYRAVSTSGSTVWQDHRARVLEVMEFGEGDLALLKVEAENLPAIELAPEGTIGVGSAVVTVGYAGTVESVTDVVGSPSYKDGTVSSERTLDGGLVPVYEVSAAMSGGMSGGPTVDSEGRVVGVNSFGIRNETQQFNFVSPVSMVAEILSSRNVSNELDGAAAAYREGLAALWEGDKDAALVGLETAKEAWGSLDVIEDQIAAAGEIPDPEPETTTTIDNTTTTEPTTRTTDTAERAGGESDDGVNLGLAALGLVGVAGAGAAAYRARSAKPNAGAGDPIGRLEQLKQLRDAGVISDSDFEAAKAQAMADLTGAGV